MTDPTPHEQMRRQHVATSLKFDACNWYSAQLMQHTRPMSASAFRAKYGNVAGGAYDDLLAARKHMDRLVELARAGKLKILKQEAGND